MKEVFDLAYPVWTVRWTGTVVTRAPEAPFRRNLQILHELGIRSVMTTGYVTIEEPDFDYDEETRRIGDMLEGLGMHSAQHHGLCAICAPNPADDDAVIEKLVDSCRYTANLRARALVIHPGMIEGLVHQEDYSEAFKALAEKEGREALLKRCARNLDAAGEEARGMGVCIALENADLFNSEPAWMADLFQHITSEGVGVCLDSGHAHLSSMDVVERILTYGKRIVTTHFHDNRGKADEHLSPGFGTIPWLDVIQALRAIGYDHDVNFETNGWPIEDAREGYVSAIRYWRTCEKLSLVK
ncbi:MAG: sugar phosphate isomerase/epimerase family protein [Kiritimatiellia bacterium]|jgi:sugar phosphate isomerase/epimerase